MDHEVNPVQIPPWSASILLNLQLYHWFVATHCTFQRPQLVASRVENSMWTMEWMVIGPQVHGLQQLLDVMNWAISIVNGHNVSDSAC